VHIIQYFFDKIPIFLFFDFNIQYEAQFTKLEFDNYAKVVVDPNGIEWVVENPWVQNLYNSIIMTLLDIPHFACRLNNRDCNRFLLSRLHEGLLWLDKKYLVDLHVIYLISRLPTSREYMGMTLATTTVMKKYNTHRGSCGAIILLITNLTIRFVTHVLS